MYDYRNLEYGSVFKYFKEICAIPHGSGNMKQISNYCVNFAKKTGLKYRQDTLGNVLIKKEATPGYQNHAPVLLQGHLDMVCEKDPNTSFDFMRDGLQIDMQDDNIFAHGTTLGGDNGIAVAMCLALLEAKDIEHPPLEVLFTVDEEIGLLGAEGLDCSDIHARRMINLDSEDEGIFTVSCAGGAGAVLRMPLESDQNTLPCYKVTISGLQGGHSGVEIDKGRLNANIIAGEFLSQIGEYRLISINGGQKDNAIPPHAEIILATECDVFAAASAFESKTKIPTDPDLKLNVEHISQQDTAYSAKASKSVAEFLTTVPNGIIAMSENIPGLVETSLNLGILKTEENILSASFGVRSSVNEDKQALLNKLQAFSSTFGGTAEFGAFYPAWEFKKDSVLQKTMCKVWQECFNKKPKIEAIHAGLECGFFCEKIEDLDAVSIGPNMSGIHTYREKLSISSTQRIYKFLIAVLKQL